MYSKGDIMEHWDEAEYNYFMSLDDMTISMVNLKRMSLKMLTFLNKLLNTDRYRF